MKILHASDIHGDIGSLEDVLKFGEETNVDAVALTGDFLGKCVSDESAKKMHMAYGAINQVAVSNEIPFDEALKFLNRKILGANEEIPEGLRLAASDYTGFVAEFDQMSADAYTKIRTLFNGSKLKDKIVVIPGNWDGNNFASFLGYWSVHEGERVLDGRKFAGFGEANATPIYMPPTRIIGYSEQELFHTLTGVQDAEVVLTHIPPYGILDEAIVGVHEDESGKQQIIRKNIGSFANLAYISRVSPTLLIVGHAHDPFGAVKDPESSTVVVNSGNLGEYEDSHHKGTFHVIELNSNNYVSDVTPYQTKMGKVEELVDSVK